MLWFLIVGVIAGYLAGLFFQGRGFGLWGDLITGILGAFLGGFIFKFLGIAAYSMIGSIVVSTIGAIILLWILRMFTGKRTR